ncbi:hypothetical protein F5Y17DRAFT_425919 [Xylariaceae sp. FL0594]|nr:hypothetical protein F5Y17DRAFT_425919 [Xylariaceae sp. FL0594]
MKFHDCSLPHLFPDEGVEAGETPSPGRSFQGFYDNVTRRAGASCPRSRTTSTENCHSKDRCPVGTTDAASSGGTEDDRNNGPGSSLELPLVSRSNIETMRLLYGDSDSCPYPYPAYTTATATTTSNIEVESWMSDIATKRVEVNMPELVQHSSQTLLRTFRSWPRMLAKGIQLPPTIHFLQFCDDLKGGVVGTPKLLARCITLCKLWVGQAEGSGQIVGDAVRAEVDCILSRYSDFDALTLLTALQSINILLVLLMFPSKRQRSITTLPDTLLSSIETLCSRVLSTGMVLHEEATHSFPVCWQIWAHIEAKRRALLSVYFLMWAYGVATARDGGGGEEEKKKTRFCDCAALARMPMPPPGPKYLWQATDARTWRSLYSRWLAQWNGGRSVVHAEFCLVEKGFVMDERMEMWLEDADELGILFMSVVNAIKQEPSRAPTRR